jgi:hypothetical protein
MKILSTAFRSRGDVSPLPARCRSLLEAGHEARLAGPPEKSAWAAESGCRYHPIGGGLTAFSRRERKFCLRPRRGLCNWMGYVEN